MNINTKVTTEIAHSLLCGESVSSSQLALLYGSSPQRWLYLEKKAISALTSPITAPLQKAQADFIIKIYLIFIKYQHYTKDKEFKQIAALISTYCLLYNIDINSDHLNTLLKKCYEICEKTVGADFETFKKDLTRLV